MQKKKIGIIGVGNMGEAILRGLHQKGMAKGIVVSEIRPDRGDYIKKNYGVEAIPDNQKLASQVQIIILAVKPQELKGVLQAIAPALDASTLLISIAAGASLGAIASILAKDVRLVRAMPNIAALALESATALSPGGGASAEDMEVAQEIFNAMGKTVVIPEALMDAVTGMSGSGPAYVCLFIEALADGGVRMGLPRKDALEMAIQTVLGTARLLSEQGEHPAHLKDRVASPGGTTIAGIASLEAKGFRGAVMEAVAAATQRSKELAKIPG
ncbi:MAG: pyrroline-5-carboxylate reductase [Deltaproteobacteria bacterium RBG_13_52_11]|nr:MAG: pyrroline-5-carboxylate reductase [Deltaproteobacteria bacterium RBG_13_52_11]